MTDDRPSLDEMSLPATDASVEGLDVNHASRARIQFLAAQSAALLTQTQFADAKAAALMTISGLLALNGPLDTATVSDASALLLASFALNAACIAGCFLSILPRFPASHTRAQIYRHDRFSWPGLIDTHHGEDDFPDFMRRAEASQLVLSLARANQATARVLHRKFAILRGTFLLGLSGLCLLALDGLLGLVP